MRGTEEAIRETEETTTRTSFTRLTVNLSQEVAKALRDIAKRHGWSITETVRRSISTQKYIDDAVADGAKILIAEKGEPVRELVFY